MITITFSNGPPEVVRRESTRFRFVQAGETYHDPGKRQVFMKTEERDSLDLSNGSLWYHGPDDLVVVVPMRATVYR